MGIVPVKGADIQSTEAAWFAPLCSDDFRCLGVPDGELRSSWATIRPAAQPCFLVFMHARLVPTMVLPGQGFSMVIDSNW